TGKHQRAVIAASRVAVPLMASVFAPASMSSVTPPPFPENMPPANILLVDDEVRNLDVLDSLLDSPEYNLVRALTAERALMLLLDGDFAAIVLDIQMPGMSGLELATLIKQRRRT